MKSQRKEIRKPSKSHENDVQIQSLCCASFLRRSSLRGAILLLASTINAQAQYNYTTFNVPGATETHGYGVSGDNIVGYYQNSEGIYGFLYNGSSYTTLSVPGALDTDAEGISGNDIVGDFSKDGNTYHGFLATSVPEPSALGLLAAFLAAFLVRRRRLAD